MKAVGKIVWSGRTASPGVVQEPYTGVSRQSLPKDEPATSFSAKEPPRTDHRQETEVSPKPTLEGLGDQTNGYNTPSGVNVKTIDRSRNRIFERYRRASSQKSTKSD